MARGAPPRKRLEAPSDESSPLHQGGVEVSTALSVDVVRLRTRGADYVQAQRFRSYFRAAMAKIFGGIDVLVMPTSIGPADLRDAMTAERRLIEPSFTAQWNLAGLPAMVLPVGFTNGPCRCRCRCSSSAPLSVSRYVEPQGRLVGESPPRDTSGGNWTRPSGDFTTTWCRACGYSSATPARRTPVVRVLVPQGGFAVVVLHAGLPEGRSLMHNTCNTPRHDPTQQTNASRGTAAPREGC